MPALEHIDGQQPTDTFLAGLQAEQALANLELCEELAELSDAEASPKLRRLFASKYRRLIGVDPSARHELRTKLEAMASGNFTGVGEN